MDYIELKNPKNNSYAKIYPHLGASIQELILDKKTILKNKNVIDYHQSFSSAILFPFTGRVKDGNYTFLKNEYQLELNHIDKENAIHGLIYNKSFHITQNEVIENNAHLKLEYLETEKNQGFPFKYHIEAHYILSEQGLKLTVNIKNTDSTPFPFSLGWHPYFHTNDLYNSCIKIASDKRFSFSDDMIPNKTLDFNSEKELQIKDQKFDDCFKLKNNKVCFKTPNYKIEISSTSKENYLQLFTLENRVSLAIEPMTGLPNNFNNKIGLQILNPNENYTVSWNIKLK